MKLTLEERRQINRDMESWGFRRATWSERHPRAVRRLRLLAGMACGLMIGCVGSLLVLRLMGKL